MNIDSIHFKGHSCFKKEWAGFDTIKPINIIIGRNNSGKSHLLDLVEALCSKDKIDSQSWQYRYSGILDEETLRNVFREGEIGKIRQTLSVKSTEFADTVCKIGVLSIC